jgi:YYY domain-containing protein
VQVFPALHWAALYLAVGAAGVPVAALLFPRFPRRGAAFALPVALVVVALPAYWVGQVAFGIPALAVGLACLLGAAAFARRRLSSLPWGGYAAASLVFLAAFGLVTAVRAHDPAIHHAGGEKFLDFALVNAVRRAETLPPEDPWFAGRAVRYYYGGHLLTALLIRLTGTAPSVAYNLAVPGFYAAMVTAAYGLAGAVAAEEGYPRRLAGLAGAFFVGLAGTLATPGRALLGVVSEPVARQYGDALLRGIKRPSDESLAYARGIVDGGILDGSYAYWWARRVVPNTPNVFPSWTFFNGDLRPHMTGAAFLLLAAALAYSYYLTPESETDRRRALLFGALPLVAGLLALVNLWDLPAVAGLVGLVVALADADPTTLYPRTLARRVRLVAREGALRRPVAAAGPAAVVGLVGAVVAAPVALVRTADNEGLAFLPPRTDLVGLLLVSGAFLCLFALYLLPRFRALVQSDETASRPAVAAAASLVCLAGLLVDFPALALFGPLVVLGWALRRSGGAGFTAVLVVAGAGLALVPELVAARVWPYDPNAPRWNTVYKISMQTWLLWGVAAGAALVAVVTDAAVRMRDRARAVRRPAPASRSAGDRLLASTPHLGHLVANAAAVLLVAALVVGAAAFPVFTLNATHEEAVEEDVELSLDGTRYVERTHALEAAAIAWLDERPGTPTIVTFPSNATYGWRNAPSALTGIPTVVGWEHQVGYHGRDPYERRVADVHDIYRGDDATTRRLLARYEVRYIYVGPLERAAYGERDFAALGGVEVAYRNEGVTIYRVGPPVTDDGSE